uniref:Venom S1 protease with CUB domain 10 n=1 Tax=Oncocephalus sp. TaxID=2944721 RepID=A0AB38ZEQ2_9HEMI
MSLKREMALYIQLLVACSILACSYCLNEQKEIQIPIGQEVTLESTDYPNSSLGSPTSLIWNLVSPPGTRITVECSDIRISPTKNCEKGFLMLMHVGGKSPPYCGAAFGILETSPDNKMTLQFELIFAGGVFQCSAQANSNEPTNKPVISEGNSEKLNLKFGQAEYKLIQLSPIPPAEKFHWEITTEPGYKVAIKCPTLWLQNSLEQRGCLKGFVSFDLGNSKVEICNSSKDLTLLSSGEKLTVYVESTKSTVGMIVCTVLSTTGPHFEQFKNDPELPEEDSSEHGHPQKPGPKKTTCDCGWANKAPSRILHGSDVAPHEFPWMVGLLGSAQATHTFCGGTIVTKRHVISAAHCTLKIEATHVIVGTDHLVKREGAQVIPVEKTINHDYRNGYSSSQDISLLILAEEIKFGPTVGPACLPTVDPHLGNNEVIAMGWGGMAKDEWESNRDENQLKKAELRALHMNSCNPIWDGRWPTNPQTHICSWDKEKDVCFGDSGGPVVWLDKETNRYTLVGIPSACDGCILQKPAIHTALHYYYPWVLETIKSNNYADQQVCTKID